MPLYEFLCLAKPSLARAHLSRMMTKVGEIVMGDGGIVTEVVSYGEQSLAYDIRKPIQKHDKVRMRVSCAAFRSNSLRRSPLADISIIRRC